MSHPAASRFLRMWLFLILLGCCQVIGFVSSSAQEEYDSSGQIVSFYPCAMMIAQNAYCIGTALPWINSLPFVKRTLLPS